MTPWNPTGRTYSISTCNIPEGWSIWALLVLWKPAGRWLSLGVEQILENMLICLSNVPSGWWHTVAQNHAHLTVCTQLMKDFWSAAFSDTEPYLVKLNSRWKTPSNLLLAICHFWVLANKPNLQLIYNDLNSKESSCTLISDAFPSGFPACWGFWSYFLQPWAASLNLYPVPPSLELPYIQFSWLISLFFLPWGSRFILFFCDDYYLIDKKMLESTRLGFFYPSACLELSLIFCKSLLDTGPLPPLLGGWVGLCSACRAHPWRRLGEGSSFWFMRTWPGMVLWKNSALSLSESSRRKWLIPGIRRTGHLLAL